MYLINFQGNANAFTSFNITAYLFAATSNIEENIETLMDYVQSPYFTEESVQKEQGIIGQEIRMYDDSGSWKLFFNFLNCLYKEHPVKKEIAGTVESISHITPEYLYKCYDTFYNLSNMSIVVVGNVDPVKISKVIENGVKKNEPFEEKIKKVYPTEPDEVAKQYAEQSLSVAMPLFMTGFKDTNNGFGGDELLKKSIETNIILKMLFGRSSKFYKSLYEKGLINNRFSLEYTMQPDYAYSSIDGESSDPKAVYEAVINEVEETRKNGLSKEDFERIKKVVWGEYIRSQNDVEDYAVTFLQMLFMDIDYFNFYDVYKTITFEDVQKRFEEHFVKEHSALSVINPLLDYYFDCQSPDKVFDLIKNTVLTSSEIVEFTTIDEAISFSTSGFALLVVDGCSRMLAIGAQGFSFRSVSEPESEVVQRGCREGFTEPLRINMTLIRRRIKSPDLVFETVTSGYSSNTQMMICYLQNSVSKQILKAIRERLDNCNLKMILASGYLSSYLEDNNSKSLFSGVGISERPDTVCGKLSEGRVAILIDGTPSVIIIPHLFAEEFQSVDDYSNRPYYAAFIRILKYISFLIAVFLPGIYTAFAQFHPEYFPTGLLVKTSDSLSQTPLPVTLEVILITFIYEVMREAGLRIPKPLGHAVSIVGALVIGESAVSAGIISSSTLMVVATAAICSYVTFALYPPIMVLRFFCVIAGGMFGLWGIVLLTCGVLVNMCSKTSIGVPYMSSLAPFSWRSMRDVFVRADWKRLSKHTIKVQKFPETEEM